MPSQFLPLLRNEVAKAVQRKLPYFGIFVIGLLSLLIHVAADQLSTAAGANAWGYAAFSMQMIFNDLGLICIIVFAAMLLSEETGTGAIRAALAAPVHRWEFYLAKAAVGLLYMLVLSFAALLFSLALTGAHYRFDAVGDSYGEVYARAKVLQVFLLAYVLSWVPLGALVMYGLFISTVVRSPGAAVAVGISTIYLVDFTKHLVGLDPYIFTKYIAYPWLILQHVAQGMDYQWQPDLWQMLGLSGAYALAGFGAGLLIFARQDLNH
jgi:ABC-type transport system involved in multi-copper enzyme maturation permease subunit